MHMQEMPDFIGLNAEIWARFIIVLNRARAIPAGRGARLRQAARAALILRSA